MQIFDIRNFINSTSLFENVSVVCQQALTYDPTSVVYFLEMRISETDEYFVDGFFRKIVMEGFHRVGSDNTCIQTLLILRIDAKWIDLFAYEVCHLVSDFLA